MGVLYSLLTEPLEPERCQKRPQAKIVELWPEADRELFEERAAIREFDGGMDWQTAERLALDEKSGRPCK